MKVKTSISFLINTIKAIASHLKGLINLLAKLDFI